MNPFRRLLSLFRRKPGMIGTPPSARQVPADPGLHAIDFSHRYAEPMDYLVSQRMDELGIHHEQIGMPADFHGIRHAAFHPHGTQGGNVSPDGRIVIDSGLFNTDYLKADYGEAAAKLYEQSRLRHRLDSIIAHEYEEHRHGMSHVEALRHAATTELPISDGGREIARAMKKGWKWR
jgi:hypothetical protein